MGFSDYIVYIKCICPSLSINVTGFSFVSHAIVHVLLIVCMVLSLVPRIVCMVLSLVPSAVRGGDNSTKHSCLKLALSHSLHNALHFDIIIP